MMKDSVQEAVEAIMPTVETAYLQGIEDALSMAYQSLDALGQSFAAETLRSLKLLERTTRQMEDANKWRRLDVRHHD